VAKRNFAINIMAHLMWMVRKMNKKAFSKIMEKNPQWKGDKVGYDALHGWIRHHKPKPELCERCKAKPPRDLANISGKYLRDINDFEWLCRKCHMEKDGRLKDWVIDNLNQKPYLEMPSREEIEKLQITMSNKEMGKHYNVGQTTIFRWKKIYNIQNIRARGVKINGRNQK
jgi:hypothetical protein